MDKDNIIREILVFSQAKSSEKTICCYFNMEVQLASKLMNEINQLCHTLTHK